MIRTRVGYTGGITKNPTYGNLGDHTEAIQIEYDPTRISYQELLNVFWKSHDPTRRSWSRQYMAAVYVHNEEQRRLAMKTREREAIRRQDRIITEVVSASVFHPAEAYHQKYRLRRDIDLMEEFRAIYPNNDDFVASTAAARVNGYLGGHGTCEGLRSEIRSLGLSPTGQKKLLHTVCKQVT